MSLAMGRHLGHAGQVPPAPAWSFRCLLEGLGSRAAARLGGGLSFLLGSRAGDALGVLMYHRVAPPAGGRKAPTWNVPPERFRAQLEGLLAGGYRPLALRAALARSRDGQAFPRRSFVVTFDDGYENVYRHAWPVLRELRVPATIFLATAYLDSRSPFPFDDWAHAGSASVAPELWRPLSTAQCGEMLEGGLVELGSHTHTHAVLSGRPDDFRRDLDASLDVLRGRFGLADVTFSFPHGVAGPELTEGARRSGVLCALTTVGSLVRPGSDPFAWGRFDVRAGDTARTIRGRLDGWYELARNAWLRCCPRGRPARPRAERSEG